jgi:NADPH-dependent curcumin reductase CurA
MSSSSPNALHLIARPVGEPKDSDFELRPVPARDLVEGEARVRVSHVSIDPAMRIWMTEQKSYWPPVALGEVMRAAGYGQVIESRNARLPVGTWLSGMTGVTEELYTDGRGLRPLGSGEAPDPARILHLFGATGLTAYFGLKEIAQPKAGETVVVSAAAGAVGSTVVQLAKAWGCRVVGIAGGPEKCAQLISEFGADAAVDYKASDVGKALSAACPEGIDVYFDNVGGDILDAVLKRLRMHARVVVCGGISQYNATGAPKGIVNHLALISARARMEGFVVIDYLQRAEEAIAAMAPLIASGRLKGKVDVLEGIARFPEALRRVLSGGNVGKQVLSLA